MKKDKKIFEGAKPMKLFYLFLLILFLFYIRYFYLATAKTIDGINMKEYTELIQQNAIKDYINQSQTQNFESDNLSDDQIFMLDLIDRFGDSMSNEEIESELENAKQDEELFQKKVEVIRSNYKQKEDEIRIANEQEEDVKRKQDYEEFANSITQSINNLNEIQGVELESEDKQ